MSKAHEQLIELLDQTWECFPAARPLTAQGHAMYRETFRGWKLKEIKKALLAYTRTAGVAWPPTPGQVLEIAARGRRKYNSRVSGDQQTQTIIENATRDVNRVRKMLPGNTGYQHKVQKFLKAPHPMPVASDEIVSGSDDQRFALRSEIE